jgi:hypothetical protein
VRLLWPNYWRQFLDTPHGETARRIARATARGRAVAAIAALTVCTMGSFVAAAAPAPRAAVAAVGSTSISLQAYQHWASVARHEDPRQRPRATRRQVMEFLISSAWIEGEAAEQNIVVTAQQVDTAFQRLRHDNFRNAKEFRRFLRSTGENVADLKYRTRVNLLSDRLRNRISPQAFTTKWRARTLCAPAYTVSDCGGPLPPPTKP